MNDEAGRLPGDVLRRVLEWVLSQHILDSVVMPTLADLQHEYALVREAPAWRQAFVLARGYLGVWNALALCLASWPARCLRRDWLAADAAGPSLLRASAPRVAILGLGFTLLLLSSAPGRQLALLRLPSVITVTLPAAFLLGLILGLSRLSARSTALACTRWLGAAFGLSMASALLTFGLYAWVTPQANQAYREQAARLVAGAGSERARSIARGSRELTLSELREQIRTAQEAGQSTRVWDVEWHKRWAIPAACVVFGPLALGLHGLWKRPRPIAGLALAVAAMLVLYQAFRIGEQAALSGRLAASPAIWAGDVFLALLACGLLVRHRRFRESTAVSA